MDDNVEEVQDSFVQKMQTIRTMDRGQVNQTGHFNYDQDKHDSAKETLLNARKPQFVIESKSSRRTNNSISNNSMETGNILKDMSSNRIV
jgi:hypothetical protein